MKIKTFNYINSLGIPKQLVVNMEPKDGKYPVTLWEMRHGEFAGNGEMTREELNKYLEHFGVDERI